MLLGHIFCDKDNDNNNNNFIYVFGLDIHLSMLLGHDTCDEYMRYIIKVIV